MMMSKSDQSLSLSVMATAPGGGFSGEEKVWSDRAAAEKGGNITAIFINYRDTGGISMIRTR